MLDYRMDELTNYYTQCVNDIGVAAMALFGEHEWYFFTLRDHRYPNSVRPSRSAASGFWKATGTDKPVQVANIQSTPVAMKKALVFYVGRPPMETKTTWIMHEYRLTNTGGSTASHPSLSSSTAHPSVKVQTIQTILRNYFYFLREWSFVFSVSSV